MPERSDLSVPSADRINRWRTAVGRSSAIWARQRLDVGPSWWWGVSGAPRADYNVLCYHGPAPAEELPSLAERIIDERVPSLVMLAGPGLAGARVLADAGLVCVTATAMMVMPAPPGTPDRDARPLSLDELPAGRRIVAAAFSLTEELAEIALPDLLEASADAVVLGLAEDDRLASVVAAQVTSGTLAFWSMATPPDAQGRGLGGRLLGSLLAWGYQHEAREVAFLASPPGMRLYRSAGAEIVEHWQVWSRPRWVMA